MNQQQQIALVSAMQAVQSVRPALQQQTETP